MSNSQVLTRSQMIEALASQLKVNAKPAEEAKCFHNCKPLVEGKIHVESQHFVSGQLLAEIILSIRSSTPNPQFVMFCLSKGWDVSLSKHQNQFRALLKPSFQRGFPVVKLFDPPKPVIK